MSEVNFNQFNYLNFNNQDSVNSIWQGNDVNNMLSDLFKSLSNLFEGLWSGQLDGGNNYPSCGCTSPPVFDDGSHPSGSLQADSNKVTTPGGYTVEPMGKFEWKITGPDGKSTRIWGDPHVAESDGGKWDFKRNSTFMLPDGTRINVTTKPWGNGKMTVTSGLEIISGNDRVLVSDIDQGKGKIGQITADGYQHANSFGGNDVFVMGKETDDWSYQGREITGSNNGGESFKLGNQLAPGVSNTNWLNNTKDLISQFIDELVRDWSGNRTNPSDFAVNPYDGNEFENNFRDQGYDRQRHQNRMTDAFRALADMFDALARLASMNDRMYINRRRSMYV